MIFKDMFQDIENVDQLFVREFEDVEWTGQATHGIITNTTSTESRAVVQQCTQDVKAPV